MGALTPARGPKQPQQERSRATRLKLLEAAVSCLAERGWSGSTVAVVAERAGVSRGAAQHHFRTREDLFTAAVEHVAEKRQNAVKAVAHNLPPAAPSPAPGSSSRNWSASTRAPSSAPRSTCG